MLLQLVLDLTSQLSQAKDARQHAEETAATLTQEVSELQQVGGGGGRRGEGRPTIIYSKAAGEVGGESFMPSFPLFQICFN